MLLLDQTEIKIEWPDMNRRVHHPFPPSHDRSPGVHLSGVLRYIAQESGILAKDPVPVPVPVPGVDSTSHTEKGKYQVMQDIDEDVMPLRMALGTIFEEGIVGLYPDLQWQPGEMERDNVFGTPDGISLVAGTIPEQVIQRLTGCQSVMLEEFKLTWKSEWNYGRDRILSANWMWMSQIKGYLALLQHAGLDPALIARLHVCWVCGDYRPPSPKYMRYVVEFTQREVDALWALVLRNKNNKGVKREL